MFFMIRNFQKPYADILPCGFKKEMYILKIIRKISIVFFTVLLIIFSSVAVFAHQGRTDSSGGHHDNKNKSGLGSYHYHCGGSSAHLHKSGYCPYTDVFPSGVRVTSEKTTLKIGEEISIDAAVYPSNSCSTNVTWKSSDPSVVAVRGSKIVAKSYGTATLTAETFNGKTSSVRITVKEIKAEKVSVSGLPDSSEFYIGENIALTATITPDNVDNDMITWTSSNEDVATVSEDGKVSLLSEGEVEIVATASNGVSDKVAFAVKEKYVETVAIENESIELIPGEKQQINAIISPADATFPDLTWTTEDPAIASVSADGTITAVACGTTVVTATSKNNMSDSITVQVNEIKAKSIAIEGEKDVQIGDSVFLSAIFTPSNTTNRDIEWKVSNPEIAEVDADGKLTALKSGNITVIATSANGVIAEYNVKVRSSISIPLVLAGIAVAGVAIVCVVKKRKKKSEISLNTND